ncbi:outer membrane usher protein [Yersinia kristensenii]|uniref:outer membrane usher protein n=1 Tax=Yersinia kristensenii TaxID=28152 RepID=UPI0005DAF800|nr:outer membrane usher protein [Yersinia kristensenii]MDA5473377.1 outer membrane usher protein [Yersinia kristensenii]MDA5477388.1 outer membrane usher protein [Yersinia kristensenii]MDA5506440.1 outer membrane usher protein [Yersinia kristensenii]NIK95762.1 outer membrane usher protein [Yersinia kristensenii]NIL06302.1 outer membrane usher protein [Yersinia kristensenii]
MVSARSITSGIACRDLLRILIAVALSGNAYGVFASDDIQFNTDVLDTKDRANFDLSQFSQRGYIMPGSYNLLVSMNKQELSEQPIIFYASETDPKKSEACLSPQLIELLALKEDSFKKLVWSRGGECLDISSLPGLTVEGDLATSSLHLSVPQAWLEYSEPDWDPPSRWEDGLPGVLFDYNLLGQLNRQQKSNTSNNTLSGNGTTGANLGAWRLRADWQSRVDQNSDAESNRKWDWSRYYAYRAIPSMGAKLTLGEDFLNSAIFDSFRFSGASLATDDNMLPPNLRGYAPEITGVARTNARVIVSQQGRVLSETLVAAGPFRIQNLNSFVSGTLDVRVEELDGQVQQFQVNTASIPYLTRPGMVRYRVAAGRPSSIGHQSEGPVFGSGEFSWGINSGWSLFGGGISGENEYQAASMGIGRDLMEFGAVSVDMTQSWATLPEKGTLSGGSYRVNYSKNFQETGSQVTFAGYRFSERNFMTMTEYLDTRYRGNTVGGNKEMYTISFNQQFQDLGLSAYLNYSHQTYWDRSANDRYNLSLSRYFDIGKVKNVSMTFSAFRNRYNESNDDGVYLSLSMPIGNSATISYSASVNGRENSQRVGYSDRIDAHNNYQINTGVARSGALVSGNYNHIGNSADINANASYQEGQYSSVGLGIQGGATITAEGGALHRVNTLGGTRLLLDTQGVSGVPVQGYGSSIRTNRFGKAVVGDVNSYYRNRASIDIDNLADDVEARGTVAQVTLTEGAIGYRRFNVISGEKAMAMIRMADGTSPPFGATVLNENQQETGIVNDDGSTYLSGIKAGETMSVNWNGKAQCSITLPKALSPAILANLLLPCQPIAAGNKPPASE